MAHTVSLVFQSLLIIKLETLEPNVVTFICNNAKNLSWATKQWE